MSAASSSLRAKAKRPINPDLRLYRLRRISMALALVFAALTPFELGAIAPPDMSAIDLSGLPYVGKYFPQPQPMVQNTLRTALVGTRQSFSVHVPHVANASVTYVIQYPNGHTIRIAGRTDALGNASYSYVVTYKPHHFREIVNVRVYDVTGRLRAFTRFAIQQAATPAHSGQHS